MTEQYSAYDLAEHIFETVWLENDALGPDELALGEIRQSRGHMTNAQQVMAFGNRNVPSEPMWEILTRASNGKYYFQANPGVVFTGDPSRLRRIVITPNSPEGHILRLADSLLTRELARIAVQLEFPEKFYHQQTDAIESSNDKIE